MPDRQLKNREEHGGDFEVRWDEGWCTVGGTSYFTTKGLCPHADVPDDDWTGFRAQPQFTADELDELIATLQRARREAYGGKPPLAVTMEIVERGRKTDNTASGSLVIPNEVRINGVSVLTTGGIKVHDVELPTLRELATVTVTLPVRMLTIAAEGDLHDDAAASNTG